jgi:hypothetical protein
MDSIPRSFSHISVMEAAWTLLDAIDAEYPSGMTDNRVLDIIADARARRKRERKMRKVIYGDLLVREFPEASA